VGSIPFCETTTLTPATPALKVIVEDRSASCEFALYSTITVASPSPLAGFRVIQSGMPETVQVVLQDNDMELLPVLASQFITVGVIDR